MVDNEKKVIVFIVEGPSEEAAMGTVMKEYFVGELVQFVVVHGDITMQDYANAANIIKKINQCLDLLKQRYRYKNSDFFQIIHLADTDGVFIKDEFVQQAEVGQVRYYEDHMESGSVEATRNRNRSKAEVLFKLRTAGKVNSIPYRIYYNSCNLEHVLYDQQQVFSGEEKTAMSDAFAEKYEGHLEEFLAFIADPKVAVPGSYQETWGFIEKELNSLSRYTNMHQIFEEKRV